MRLHPPAYIPMPRYYNTRFNPIVGRGSRLTNTLFDCGGQITIGDNVFFGHDCMVLTGTHDYTKIGAERKNSVYYKPVVIGDGTWISSGVIILSGVIIGKNVIVGAGSVVTHDIPDNQMWFGVPARFHKNI